MSKGCNERRAGRAHARPGGLMQQTAAQTVEASGAGRGGQRSFALWLRCRRLKGLGLPARPRLASGQNSAARRGKICED